MGDEPHSRATDRALTASRNQRLHAMVTGIVQGVGFRFATIERAQNLRLTGWVKNLRNGSVEVLAEGSRASLGQLLAFLRRGPPAASVTDVRAEWLAATGEFKRFETRW